MPRSDPSSQVGMDAAHKQLLDQSSQIQNKIRSIGRPDFSHTLQILYKKCWFSAETPSYGHSGPAQILRGWSIPLANSLRCTDVRKHMAEFRFRRRFVFGMRAASLSTACTAQITFSSPLGLRMKISAQSNREDDCTDVPFLFVDRVCLKTCFLVRVLTKSVMSSKSEQLWAKWPRLWVHVFAALAASGPTRQPSPAPLGVEAFAAASLLKLLKQQRHTVL